MLYIVDINPSKKNFKYCKISNMTHQIPKLVSRLVLQLSLPNPMKPGVKLRMKI